MIGLVVASAWTDRLAGWSTFAQAVLVGLALVVAYSQLKDARSDRQQRERPFVVVEFDGERDPEEVDIALKNIGQTIARDVKISFDPPLSTTYDNIGFGAGHMKAFTEGVSTLNPGQSLSALFDTGPARLGSGLPDAYTVTLTYRGDLRGADPYEESMDLDLGLFKNRVYVGRKTMDNVHAELERTRKALETIAKAPR